MSYVTDGVFTDNDKIYFEVGSYIYKDKKVMIVLLYKTTNKAGFVPSVGKELEEITDYDVCSRLISEHNDEMIKMANNMATKYEETHIEHYKADMEKYLDSTIDYYEKDK